MNGMISKKFYLFLNVFAHVYFQKQEKIQATGRDSHTTWGFSIIHVGWCQTGARSLRGYWGTIGQAQASRKQEGNETRYQTGDYFLSTMHYLYNYHKSTKSESQLRLRRIRALGKEVSTSHACDSSQGLQRDGYGKYRDQRLSQRSALSQRAAVGSAVVQRAYIVALL